MNQKIKKKENKLGIRKLNGCLSPGVITGGEWRKISQQKIEHANMVTKPKARKNSPNDRRSNNVKQIFSTNLTV